MFDAFSPFPLRFSAAPTPQERQYTALKAQLGPGFESPVQEAIVYGVAMALGAAQLQQEGAAAQADPLQCTVLLDELEKDYQIVPQLGQSVNSRQLTLASAMALEAGALETAIETGLTAILGSDFIGWRSLNPDTEVEIHCGDNRQANWIIETPVDITTATLATGTCAVCYGQYLNRWVAVSSGAVARPMVYSDNDGASWSQAVTMTTSNSWSGVASDGYYYVAVGADTSAPYENAALSPNGETWTVVSTGVSGTFFDIVYGGGLFVAVGDGVTMRSSDSGATWAAGTIGVVNWNAIDFGNSTWVAVSEDGYACTSSDGESFNSTTLTGAWKDIAFGNGVFVAVRTDGTEKAYWSRDGITWTASGLTTLYVDAPTDIVFTDGLFYAVDAFNGAYATSTDGNTWRGGFWIEDSTAGLGAKPNRVIGVGEGVATQVRVYPYPPLVPDTTPIKHVRFLEDVMPGTATVSYEMILSDGNPLFVDEELTVEPGRLGQQERVTVTAAPTTTTFTATFARPHESGSRATTAPWANWQSTKQHSLVLVKSTVLTNPTKLTQINTFMRKIMPATHTWLTTTGDGAYVDQFVVGSTVGQYPIGGFLEADPT